MQTKPTCSIVVPMYNEEEVVKETSKRLKAVMESSGVSYEIIYVNDGSRDKTVDILQEICEQDNSLKLINFSRNFGHQIAITAGMDYASGDCIVVIDGDLQDPPEVILKMIEKWREGYEVVYGKRLERKGDTFFKKISAAAFYRLLRSMTDVDIPVDTGDFRLIDRKVCDELKRIHEKNRYIRGLISWLGFRQTAVEFVREERFAGVTKYPLKKMIRFAFDAITSFSYKPLRIATYFGFFVSMFSFIALVGIIAQKLLYPEHVILGWSTIISLSLLLNGIVLLMLGIIGEYIGRIYDESKNRPLYVIQKMQNFDREQIIERYGHH